MAKIFKSERHGYVCELWGSSTKHPDSIFYFDDYEKSDLLEDKYQVFQWLLECSSKLLYPMSSYSLAKQAMEDWYPMRNDWQEPELKEWTKDHWHERYR